MAFPSRRPQRRAFSSRPFRRRRSFAAVPRRSTRWTYCQFHTERGDVIPAGPIEGGASNSFMTELARIRDHVGDATTLQGQYETDKVRYIEIAGLRWQVHNYVRVPINGGGSLIVKCFRKSAVVGIRLDANTGGPVNIPDLFINRGIVRATSGTFPITFESAAAERIYDQDMRMFEGSDGAYLDADRFTKFGYQLGYAETYSPRYRRIRQRIRIDDATGLYIATNYRRDTSAAGDPNVGTVISGWYWYRVVG